MKPTNPITDMDILELYQQLNQSILHWVDTIFSQMDDLLTK